MGACKGKLPKAYKWPLMALSPGAVVRFVAIFAAVTALKADPAAATLASNIPTWQGEKVSGTDRTFLLSSHGNSGISWLRVGDSFGDWKIIEYREIDRTLVVQGSSGTKVDLLLVMSPATAATPTVVAEPAASNAFAVQFLQDRADDLKKQAEAADKKFADFEAEHAGIDPSQMPSGPTADEGNALKNQATLAHKHYDTAVASLTRVQERADSGGPK